MANDPSEAIKKLQETIRGKRVDMGLPKEGPLNSRILLETLRKNPPKKEILEYVKAKLAPYVAQNSFPEQSSSRSSKSNIKK